jgi:hypothetical protein
MSAPTTDTSAASISTKKNFKLDFTNGVLITVNQGCARQPDEPGLHDAPAERHHLGQRVTEAPDRRSRRLDEAGGERGLQGQAILGIWCWAITDRAVSRSGAVWPQHAALARRNRGDADKKPTTDGGR